MDETDHGRGPALTVIVPANDEEAFIGTCLAAVAASDWQARFAVIVVANGCRDDTVGAARRMAPAFVARGCDLRVIELPSGGKLAALTVGDAAATTSVRVYLDADVVVDPRLLSQLHDALDTGAPRYAGGRVRIPRPVTMVSRAYARIYRQVPFMTTGVPGCGLFALNSAGRTRWEDWPDIISDDTFARLNFAPSERAAVAAGYDWPLVEGWNALVRVRRRQDIGVREIARRYPHLLDNDDKPPFPLHRKIALALGDPLGFLVYAGVAMTVRLTRGQRADWSRGR